MGPQSHDGHGLDGHDDEDAPRDEGHAHQHGVTDPALLSTERGMWAVKVSLAGLLLTAALQVVVVLFTGSVALLADTIHNFSDAATAIPLWIAFALARRRPTKRFTYGYGRVEDLAGLVVVALIALSAIVAGYESARRLVDPVEVRYLWAVALASLIGFAGNEAVALLRIKVGREIGSTALVVDGYHARVDGLTSLAVLLGALGVWLGYPVADPLVGLLITLAILRILWDAAKAVFTRLLDGVDPEVRDAVLRAVARVDGVREVSDVRLRWLGHRLRADVNVAVDPNLTVEQGHAIAQEVHHRLLHDVRYLSHAQVHVDPATTSGEAYHRVAAHAHDDLPDHAH